MKQALLLVTMVLLSGMTSSCLFSRKPRPAQIYIPPAPAPELPKEQPLPQPPNLPPQRNPPPQTTEAQTQEPQPPPQEQPARRKRPVPQPPVAVDTQPPEQPIETAPSPTPRLGQMLSPDQQKEYSNAINTSVNRARENLKSLQGHSLRKDQQAVVVQIESFLNQVEEARKYDLVSARSLAERADLLASDLVKAVR